MRIRLGDLRKIIRETATQTKSNEVTVRSELGNQGDLMWAISDGSVTAVLEAKTGNVHGDWSQGYNQTFDAVVGALKEWYTTDREEFEGENIAKVTLDLDGQL